MIWENQYHSIWTHSNGTFVRPVDKASKHLIKLALRWQRQKDEAETTGRVLRLSHPTRDAEYKAGVWDEKNGVRQGYVAYHQDYTWGNPWQFDFIRRLSDAVIFRNGEAGIEEEITLNYSPVYDYFRGGKMKAEPLKYKHFNGFPFSRVPVDIRFRSEYCAFGSACCEQESCRIAAKTLGDFKIPHKGLTAEQLLGKLKELPKLLAAGYKADLKRIKPEQYHHYGKEIKEWIKRKWDAERPKYHKVWTFDFCDDEIKWYIRLDSKMVTEAYAKTLGARPSTETRAEKNRQLRALGVIA